MARRVGGGTRRATFENQSEFFRKGSTEMDFPASQYWRSPRGRARRALQSPVYIRKKDAGQKEKKEKRKNFKELKWPLWLLPTRLLKLSKAAIKKAID